MRECPSEYASEYASEYGTEYGTEYATELRKRNTDVPIPPPKDLNVTRLTAFIVVVALLAGMTWAIVTQNVVALASDPLIALLDGNPGAL